MDGCPELQLDTDPLRPARPPPSSSPGGDANKSESDLDKLRISPRSEGLTLTAATAADSAETSHVSLLSVFPGSWITLASWMLSAIVMCQKRTAQFPAEIQNCSSVKKKIQELSEKPLNYCSAINRLIKYKWSRLRELSAATVDSIEDGKFPRQQGK